MAATVIVERNASINEPVKVIIPVDAPEQRTVVEEPQPGPLVYGRRLVVIPGRW
jgi:hypothetical protein